jgi:hypothetical protein
VARQCKIYNVPVIFIVNEDANDSQTSLQLLHS